MNTKHLKYIAIAWGVVFFAVLGLHLVNDARTPVQHTIDTSVDANCQDSSSVVTTDGWSDVSEVWTTDCGCTITIDGETIVNHINDVQQWDYRVPESQLESMAKPDCDAHCAVACEKWFDEITVDVVK